MTSDTGATSSSAAARGATSRPKVLDGVSKCVKLRL
jgi:hypothetical protein